MRIDELIVGSKDDDSLYDNAKGFSNFAAPGADRLKIDLVLTKKLLTDTDDANFVELMRVQDGIVRKLQTKTQYNIIRDYLAERTNDESGSYSVDPFQVSIAESLNDRLGSNGLFFESSVTDSGNTPSEDLACLKISPGKAYVRGYDVETSGTTILDIKKPREVKSLKNRNVSTTMGDLLRINNSKGTPVPGETINLHSRHNSSGVGIGSARVYNYNLTDSAHTGPSSKWDLYLYDIQTYTLLGINTSISTGELQESFYVKGKSSGATGFSALPGAGSDIITLRQTSGTFAKGEQLIINGVESSRSVNSVNSYGIQDIKSVSNNTSGSSNAFSADTFLEKFPLPNGVQNGRIEGTTLKSVGNVFTGIKTDSIIRYQSTATGIKTEVFNRVSSVSLDGTSLELATIGQRVEGVYEGTAPIAGNHAISIGAPIIRNQNNSELYIELPHQNIASLDTSNSQIKLKLQSANKAASGGVVSFGVDNFTLPTGINTVTFSAFDVEKYSLHNNTNPGVIGTITSDTFSLNSSENIVTFRNLSDTNQYKLDATFIKPSIISKNKIYTRSTKITIDKSSSGVTTSISGLSTNPYYGVRVQDEEISLNYPDVVKVIAVYESLGTSDPTLDEITFESTPNVKDNAIIGENIFSTNSNAVARVVELSSSSHTLGIVYLNNDRFVNGEKVTFEESNIEVSITAINSSESSGKYSDITNDFTLDDGQRKQYYDYSRIVRRSGSPIPSKKIAVIFDHYTLNSTEDGDAFTVSSYGGDRYSKDIPLLGNGSVRATDTLDFRPRVSAPFNSTTMSPFDFVARSIQPDIFLSPKDDCLLGYSYYIGRIDKIFIDKFSKLYVKEGASSEVTSSVDENNVAMEVATIELPPYLYNPRDAKISLVDNKRYTMRDIGLIEDRVENLEEITTLSLLEVNTQSLQIRDSNNNERFKSGFFVDSFKNDNLINLDISSVSVNENEELTPLITSNSLKQQLSPLNSISDTELDLSTNFSLLDSNVQKTGNAVTLKYDSIGWIEQPLATRVENVNPFHVVEYFGVVTLNPSTDNWVRTIRLSGQTNRTSSTGVAGGGGVLQSVFSNTTVTSRDVVVASGSERFMRSRNVAFSLTASKPLTRYYQFLDGVGGIDFIPKLLEISPDETLENYGSTGTFTVGETVIGYDNIGNERIRFRVCTSNHKTGPFNDPTTTFNINPYVRSESIPSSYSPSSKVLNIDTFSLSEEAQGTYFGYVTEGMQLVGQSSGAIANVKSLKLISDNFGDLLGTFFIRNPYENNSMSVRDNVIKVETGTKTFKITSSSTNKTPLLGSKLISSAETEYASTGIWQQRRIVTTFSTRTTFVFRRRRRAQRRRDPLAQSFTVGGEVQAPTVIDGGDQDNNGAYVSAVDLYLSHKPSGDDPLIVDIRTVELGTPTLISVGLPKTLRPNEVNVSDTGEVATHVVFDEPIYLEGGREYAIVLLAPTTDQYEAWIARMGEKTVNTQSLPDAESVRYTRQFATGSLFKSQNGSVWTPSQYEDLKFKLYKCNFTSNSGTAFFYNPSLDSSNGYVPNIDNNPIRTLPKQVTIGISTNNNTSDIGILESIGTKVTGSNSTNGFGYIAAAGGPAANIIVTDGGSNYITDANNICDTFTVSGIGTGLVLDLAATNGVIDTVGVAFSGHGYRVGDVVGIVTSGMSSKTGTGALLTINAIDVIDTLQLSGVQGQDGSSATDTFQSGDDIKYYNSANTLTAFAGDAEIIGARTFEHSGVNDGKHIRVNHFNHGMYSTTNKVKLSNIKSSYLPTKTRASLSNIGTSISVENVADFANFEGSIVSGTNPGFIKIGGEIIGYSTVTGSSPGVIVFSASGRGIDDTKVSNHATGSLVEKYELNGLSLLRINKTHNISPLNLDTDGYHIEIGRSASGSNIKDRSSDVSPSGDKAKPQASFIDDSFLGGNEVKVTENIQFTEVIPRYDVFTPTDTSATANIRTVTGTSVDGNENSFNDVGFEPIELNVPNKLNSPRIICAKVNETEHLSNLPRNKSLTTGITLSGNENVSPIIYLDNSFMEFRLARINNPIENYSTDNRVNVQSEDPHSAIYVSNTVNLKNPASSLKVFLTAYRHESSDFRVLYQLTRPDSSNVEQTYELFPGYDNLEFADENGFVLKNAANNSGRSDQFVRPSLENEFLEYEFTANDLDLFTGFSIKIVMNSTNQAEYPRFKDIRVVAVR